jgi:hypothetical protein
VAVIPHTASRRRSATIYVAINHLASGSATAAQGFANDLDFQLRFEVFGHQGVFGSPVTLRPSGLGCDDLRATSFNTDSGLAHGTVTLTPLLPPSVQPSSPERVFDFAEFIRAGDIGCSGVEAPDAGSK